MSLPRQYVITAAILYFTYYCDFYEQKIFENMGRDDLRITITIYVMKGKIFYLLYV